MKHLERDLDLLYRHILALSSRVEEIIDAAGRALFERRYDLVAMVLGADVGVDREEVLIEEECLRLLALHQPVAIDLRRVTAVIKINSDLERMADLAVHIAECAQWLMVRPEFPIPAKLEGMFDLVSMMVRRSLDAFVNRDVHTAQHVCGLEHEVERYRDEVVDELNETMRQRADWIPEAIQCVSALQHIEGIADHATSVSEDVLYLVHGEVVRHRRDRGRVSSE